MFRIISHFNLFTQIVQHLLKINTPFCKSFYFFFGFSSSFFSSSKCTGFLSYVQRKLVQMLEEHDHCHTNSNLYISISSFHRTHLGFMLIFTSYSRFQTVFRNCSTYLNGVIDPIQKIFFNLWLSTFSYAFPPPRWPFAHISTLLFNNELFFVFFFLISQMFIKPVRIARISVWCDNDKSISHLWTKLFSECFNSQCECVWKWTHEMGNNKISFQMW